MGWGRKGVRGGETNRQPNAQTLRINSSMNRQLKTKPAIPSPSLTSSHVGSVFPSSHWYRFMMMSAKMPSRSNETSPRTV